MIVPLEYVFLKQPIDTHDQRNGRVLDKARGWECALDEDRRIILLRHKETWTAEMPVENAAHWRREVDLQAVAEEAHALAKVGGTPDHGYDGKTGTSFGPKPKGKRKS